MLNLWLIFALGMFVSIFLQAALKVRSRLNGICGYRHFVEAFMPQLVARTFLTSLGFLLWTEHPHIFSDLLGRITGLEKELFPLSLATAGLYGYAADSLLDRVGSLVPWFRKEIPPLNGEGAKDGKV